MIASCQSLFWTQWGLQEDQLPNPTHLPSPVCKYCRHPMAMTLGKMFLSNWKVHLALGFSSCISSWNIFSQVLGGEKDIFRGRSWGPGLVSRWPSCSILEEREDSVSRFSWFSLTFGFHFLSLAFGFQGSWSSSLLKRQKAAESHRCLNRPCWNARGTSSGVPSFRSFSFPYNFYCKQTTSVGIEIRECLVTETRRLFPWMLVGGLAEIWAELEAVVSPVTWWPW